MYFKIQQKFKYNLCEFTLQWNICGIFELIELTVILAPSCFGRHWKMLFTGTVTK